MARRKKKKNLLYFYLFAFFVLLAVVSYCVDVSIDAQKAREEALRIEKENAAKYATCLDKEYTEDELSENLINKIEEIDSYIIDNKFKTSVYYEDINTGFIYKYKEEQVYYGCSLIKLVDALYLIDKATAGEIDIDKETAIYESKYITAFSSGMEKHKVGEAVSLRNLIDYAISVSDNSAHLMLIDYIGFSNLKAYGKSLGGSVILTGGDLYGNQTAADTNIYLKKAYQIITENKEYGDFLKTIMDNNERNAFNMGDIKIYHKYGSYASNYHDIGLSLENNPYSISIFTLHEYTNYKEVVQGIHQKIRELHTLFYKERENYCKNLVYGE